MGRDLISAKNDVVFKALFVRNRDLLTAFVSDILDIPRDTITDLEVLNPELPPNFVDGKFSRLDIRLVTTDKNINIEMQVANTEDYRERILYYWANMYSRDLEKGENYKALNRSISVSILDYNMFDCDDCHSVFTIRENDRHELFSDRLELHFYELKKVSSKPDRDNRKQLWLQFISADSEEEYEMLRKANVPEISDGIDHIYDMSSDKTLREFIRQRDMARNDYYSDLTNAEMRGIAKGRAEGIAEGVANMRKLGYTEEQIAEIFGV